MAGKRHRKKRTRQGKAPPKPPQQKPAPPVFPKLYDSSDEFSTYEDDEDYDYEDMFEDLMHATTYDRRSGRHSPIINRDMVEIMLEEDPEMYGTAVTCAFANYARQSLDDMGRWSRPGEAGTSRNSSAGYVNKKPSIDETSKKPLTAEANKKPSKGETSTKPHAAEPDKKSSMGETSKKTATSDPDKKTSMGETSKKPHAAEPDKKPSMGETSKKPHAAEPAKKSSMGETSKKAATSDPDTKPSMGETSKKAAKSDPNKNPLMGEASKKAATVEANKKSTITEVNNKSCEKNKKPATGATSKKPAACEPTETKQDKENQKKKPKSSAEAPQEVTTEPAKKKKWPRKPEIILLNMGEEQNLATKYWELYDKIGLKDVVKIHKRTKNGEILMKLLRSADANAVKDRIDAELTEGQKTTVVTEMTEMVVTNLDLTATVEEVSEAVGTKLGRSVPPASIKLWRCQDGLQRARFRFPIKQASKVDGSEVTIGAKVCGLKISKPMAATQMRCFRCLERGHLSNACEGIDRSEKCLQCGGEGHRSKDCTDKARCLNCSGRHRIGSSRCKKAVRSG